ncbi:NAD(P)H-dependent oxidoreductase [Sphingomonas sp.]|uniref:FMN-dependent NADH-azoreductase n=1 Tax=Sphingomonas sp. TaxID=28214 RepID=UPI00286B996F|nr:NAD(P)H-dependent oxidoreductase [Sphingomonas sp.]
MIRVLHVVASPRERSRSDALAAIAIAALDRPQVTRLDLWRELLPELDGETVEGRYKLIHGEPVAADVEQRWAELRTVADRAMAHDLWLISTPMWNFGLPYRLKHWIDCITHPGMTFTNDAAGNVTGLAAGRSALLIGAGALDFADAAQEQALDFQMRYLDTWLRFIGISDIHVVRAAPTFGLPETVDAAMDNAANELRRIAGLINRRVDERG